MPLNTHVARVKRLVIINQVRLSPLLTTNPILSFFLGLKKNKKNYIFSVYLVCLAQPNSHYV